MRGYGPGPGAKAALALNSSHHIFPPTPMPPPRTFKGNKQALPSKPCSVCGRPMSWRKKWEKNWERVRYCSETCRKSRPAHG